MKMFVFRPIAFPFLLLADCVDWRNRKGNGVKVRVSAEYFFNMTQGVGPNIQF